MDNTTALTFKLEEFEGPLDLLLSLVAKNKVEICDIPIALIFDQYMEHLALMQSMDMDIAGEFIVMASELMYIKSRMLLPSEEEEAEDPRARLAEALLEYKRIKEASGILGERFENYGRRYSKDTDEIPADSGYIEPHDAELLREAFMRMFKRIKSAEKESSEIEIPFEKILRAPIVPVSVKIYSVLRLIKKSGSIRYTEVLGTARTRSELIAIFMSVLELIKNGRVLLEPVYDELCVGYDDFEMSLNPDRLKTGTESGTDEVKTEQ